MSLRLPELVCPLLLASVSYLPLAVSCNLDWQSRLGVVERLAPGARARRLEAGMERVVVILTEADGGSYDADVIPREEAERMVRSQEVEALARIAYRAAYPNAVADVIGQAVLDLKTGEVTESGYVEGHRDAPGYDNLLVLYECDAARDVPSTGDLTLTSLLPEKELETVRAVNGGENPTGPDPVVRYLQSRNESVEQREEDLFAAQARESQRLEWDGIRAQLDRVYGGGLAGEEDARSSREAAQEVARRLDAYGKRLEEDEREVLLACYGLGESARAPASYGEIAQARGATRESVRQMRLRAEERIGFGPDAGAELHRLRRERNRLLSEREQAGHELDTARSRLEEADRRLEELAEDPLLPEALQS